jgi:hypothetical protein
MSNKHIIVNIELNNNCGTQTILAIHKISLRKVTISIGHCRDGSGMFECTITYDDGKDNPIYESHCCSRQQVEDSLNSFYIAT